MAYGLLIIKLVSHFSHFLFYFKAENDKLLGCFGWRMASTFDRFVRGVRGEFAGLRPRI